MVIELTNTSGQKIRYKILRLHVSSLTCWLRNTKPTRSVNGLAIGQLMVVHAQSMLGKLITPNIMMLGNAIMYDFAF